MFMLFQSKKKNSNKNKNTQKTLVLMCTLRVKMQSSIYSVALLTPTGTERNKGEKKNTGRGQQFC